MTKARIKRSNARARGPVARTEASYPVSIPEPEQIEADLHSLTRWGLMGWASIRTDTDRPIEVEAVLDGRSLGRTIASDVKEARHGRVRVAFTLGFHDPVTGPTPPTVTLRRGDAVTVLQDRPWSAIEGFVDEITVWGATGWAWSPIEPEAVVTVEARIDGRLIGRANADRMRDDIGASGRGTGLYGFVLTFDAPIALTDSPVFSAIAGDGTTVSMPSSPMSEVVGFVDGTTRRKAVGWTWRPELPETPLVVEAVLDGNVIGRTLANGYLEHLEKSGRGTGRYAFELTFDSPITGDIAPTIRASVEGRSFVLPVLGMFDPAVTEQADGAEPALPAQQLKAGEGAVDYLTRHSVTGWAWEPGAPAAAVIIEAVLDGRLVGTTVAEHPREDLAYWGKGTGRYGFTLNFDREIRGDSVPRIFGRTTSGLFELGGGKGFMDSGDATAGAPPEKSAGLGQDSAEEVDVDLLSIEGNVDYLTRSGASGWAWQPGSPDTAVTVRAVLHGQVIGSAVAEFLREDLAHWGKGTGRYGFTLSFDDELVGADAPQFEVAGPRGSVTLSSAPLSDEPAVPAAPSGPPSVEGHVDRLTRWEVSGWAWMPSNPQASVEMRAVLEGKIIGQAVAEELRQDLFDWGKGTGRYGYHMVFDSPVVGDKAPLLLPYVPSHEPLTGNTALPTASKSDMANRPRGTIEMLLAQHGKFTGAGPHFEEFDPAILEGVAPAMGTPEPWLIAFYLPQFHAIDANDRFWGAGFTEWRQLPRAISRYPGHYQPRVPRDLGFYNLLANDTLEHQFAMAKAAGVTAFAYYYYWFNGNRVLEKPLDNLLRSTVEVPFMIIWANENWTRTWDGSEGSILLRQDYREADDKALVADWARHFRDPRYLRIEGRPFFVIYNPSNIPEAAKAIARWRKLLRRHHKLNPLIFMAQTFGSRDPVAFGLDGALEFPPHKLSDDLPGRRTPDAYSPTFSGRVIDYEDFAMASLSEPAADFPLIKTVVPSWDNESRRPNRGLSLEQASPRSYEAWLRALFVKAVQNPVFGQPVVAVNAWNEWAEGAYLEPDVYFGAAYLNATARARKTASLLLSPAAVARPRVTVIFPNYNHESFIVERINSVLNQTIRPDEIIFLDDCSSDGSVELARQTLAASTIPYRMVLNETNSGGVFRQWVRGLELAEHDLIWVAETDDSVDPDFLLHILPQFEDKAVSAALGHIKHMDVEGNILEDLDGYWDDLVDFSWDRSCVVPAYKAFSWDFAIKNVIPNASGLVFRKPKLTEAEVARLFNYRFAGDWYFYALVLRGGSLAYSRAAKSYFRVSAASASRSAFFTERHLAEHVMVINDLRYLYGISPVAIKAHAASLGRYLKDRSLPEIEALLSAPLADSRPRPLRICIAAHSFDVGGGEVLPLELANELRRSGHHVTYLVVERPHSDGGNLQHRLQSDIPTVYWDDVKANFGMFLTDYGIEVLNSHNVSLDFRLALRQQEIAIPYVASLHGGYETVPGILTEDFFAYVGQTVTSWLFLSEKNLTSLKQQSFPDQMFRRSFNAVSDFEGEWVDRAAFRAEHGIPQTAFVLVLCSRAIEEKGWGVAVEVVASVAKQSKRDVRLVLIGDGPAAVALRSAPAAEMQHVTMLGQVDRPIRYFRCFDAAIFPSTFSGETFPLFLLEAFMAGLPVISTDIGEISHIMGADEGQRPGALVAHDQDRRGIIDDMSTALTRIVTSPKTFKRMCKNAHDASLRFSMPELAAFYVTEFRRVCESSARYTPQEHLSYV